MENSQRKPVLLLTACLLVVMLAFSGMHSYDRPTWLLEVFPILIALPLLVWTYQRFPLTNLLYALLFLHAGVLMLGAYYTYARVPWGFDLAALLNINRNPYDKIGHFFQGFVPAIVAREILFRGNFVKPGKMCVFLILCVVLAISAAYELIEWGAAIILGQGAEAFLGMQGDPWDTQSDMLMALIGGGCALSILSRHHDRQLGRLLLKSSREPERLTTNRD